MKKHFAEVSCMLSVSLIWLGKSLSLYCWSTQKSLWNSVHGRQKCGKQIIFKCCSNTWGHFMKQILFYGSLHSKKQNGWTMYEYSCSSHTSFTFYNCWNNLTWLLHWIVMNSTVHNWLNLKYITVKLNRYDQHRTEFYYTIWSVAIQLLLTQLI